MELGLQSFCLRGIKDHAAVADAVKQTGLRRLEMCRAHTEWDNPEAFGQLAERYRDAGVPIVSIGVNKIGTDRQEATNIFECAKAAGLERMSVDFPLDGLEQALAIAEELSESYGILLGIHNHGGRHWLGSTTALRWVFDKTSTRVGLSLDTAWALDSREDPIAVVREFGERLHLVHIKDFEYEKDRTPRDVVVGTGNLDLRELDAALQEVAFSGEAVLEYEGDVDNPVPALRECVGMVGDQMKLVTVPEKA
jgi:sugar phosphate isomerase/epimerase